MLKTEKKHEKASYLLSYIYYEWKEYVKALACLENVRDTAGDRVFFNKYYGFCCYHTGSYDDAVNYLTTALESSPAHAKYKKYLKGLTYENKLRELGDLDGKIREIEATLMGDRTSIQEYTRLSMLYIFKGEYKKAEELLSARKTLDRSGERAFPGRFIENPCRFSSKALPEPASGLCPACL